jgi:hypothetical protein
LPTVLNCRAKRLLPGPDGHVPFLFPRFATRRPSRTNPPLCGIFPCLPCGGACYRRSIYGSGVHLQCAVVRLAPAVRWLSSGSSRQKMAFPPGCGSCVARTEKRRRRLLCTGGCMRCYLSRIGGGNLHYSLAVVFIVDILPVERATCHIGLAHTGPLCGMSAWRLGVLARRIG